MLCFWTFQKLNSFFSFCQALVKPTSTADRFQCVEFVWGWGGTCGPADYRRTLYVSIHGVCQIVDTKHSKNHLADIKKKNDFFNALRYWISFVAEKDWLFQHGMGTLKEFCGDALLGHLLRGLDLLFQLRTLIFWFLLADQW